MTSSSALILVGAAIGGTLLVQYVIRKGIFGAVTENALKILREKSNSRVGGAEVSVDNVPKTEAAIKEEELENESSSSKSVDERAERILKRKKDEK